MPQTKNRVSLTEFEARLPQEKKKKRVSLAEFEATLPTKERPTKGKAPDYKPPSPLAALRQSIKEFASRPFLGPLAFEGLGAGGGAALGSLLGPPGTLI
ncbi:MAG: hypothetical protein ACREBU_07405, partial [Nitrososphaera sp.]